MVTSPRSLVRVDDDLPQVFYRSRSSRARITLLAWTTCFGLTATGCHDTDPGRLTTGIGPLGAPSRTSISSADTGLLQVRKTEKEIAELLRISSAQARMWLQRLVDEKAIEKLKKPAG